STRADCPNGRMRFSEDGESLAIPSMGGNSTTVFSWRAKTSVRIANSTDVNDAIPFAKGTLVATVDDANLAYVVDVRTRKAIVSSSIARDPPKHDLNAVYVSSTRNEIYFGGEDNLVWIFGFKHRDESATFDFFSVRRLGPLYGGIEDILSVSNDRTLVATDSGNIYLFDADWHELAKTGYGGALSTRTESMRLSPNGRSVLVTHNGQLFVWSGDPLPPKHAGHAFGEPQSVYGMGTRTADHGLTDAVFTAGLEGRVLWRVRKPAKNTANVYPEKIAEYTHPPRILPLSGGTRLVRVTESGFCRFEQLVQGKLTPIETHFTGKCPVGINHPHRTKAGVVDNTGALSTIDQTGRVRKVGTFGLPYEGMTDRANLRYLNGAWEFQDGSVTERIRDR
ncbi:MAG: hypothetical protein KBF88_16225, partial [Polyangiaceae bacterium]|nr:hypothetical protein [Polyangiaceae bacterium]